MSSAHSRWLWLLGWAQVHPQERSQGQPALAVPLASGRTPCTRLGRWGLEIKPRAGREAKGEAGAREEYNLKGRRHRGQTELQTNMS